MVCSIRFVLLSFASRIMLHLLCVALQENIAVLQRPWEQQPEPEPLDLSQLSVHVLVKDGTTGRVTFETRLPAGFLEPVAAAVPQLVRPGLCQLAMYDLWCFAQFAVWISRC